MKQEDENDSSSLVGAYFDMSENLPLEPKGSRGFGFRAKSKEAYVVPSLHLHDL